MPENNKKNKHNVDIQKIADNGWRDEVPNDNVLDRLRKSRSLLPETTKEKEIGTF